MGIKRWWAIVGRAGWREGAMLKVAKKIPHLANSLYNTLAQVFRSKTVGAPVTPKTQLAAVQVTYSGRWFFARFPKVHLNHELPFIVGHVTAFVIIRDIKVVFLWARYVLDRPIPLNNGILVFSSCHHCPLLEPVVEIYGLVSPKTEETVVLWLNISSLSCKMFQVQSLLLNTVFLHSAKEKMRWRSPKCFNSRL